MMVEADQGERRASDYHPALLRQLPFLKHIPARTLLVAVLTILAAHMKTSFISSIL